MKKLTLRQKFGLVVAGLTVRRRAEPKPSVFDPAEADPLDLLPSRDRYALIHEGQSARLKAYCEKNPRIQAVKARYEAAWWSPDRTYLVSYVQDAEADGASGQRRELMRLMRWFEKNNPTLQKILDLLETNVVGTGINPTPATSATPWNKASLKWWNRWCRRADLSGRNHFYALQAMIVRAVALDGECFLHLTKDPESDRPRVHLIESHRVTTNQINTDSVTVDYIDSDGVLVDKETGRPLYYVVTSPGAATARVIPAREIIHIYEPSRASQYRGITLFHAIINTLHDLNDLQMFEMQAAKAAAVTAQIIKTVSGEAPESLIGEGALEEAPKMSPDDKTRYYAKQFGSATRIIQSGDEWEQAQNNRPSPAMRDFWQYLERKVCQGVGISAAAVLDYEGSWGGAALRGAVFSDNRFYEVRSESLVSALCRVWEWAVGWAIEHGEIESEAPDGWNHPRWQAPRRSTVDIGRDSTATINELRAGLRTYEDIYAENGEDSVERLTKRADEAAFIQKLAADRGIAPESIAALDPTERSAQIQADATVTAADTRADAANGSADAKADAPPV